MSKYRIAAIGITIVLALLGINAALAKEIVGITITGPGLEQGIEISDREEIALFQELRFGNLTDQPAADPGEAYFEVRLAIGVDDQIVATDVHHYYFTPQASYMYYADVIGGWSDAEGKWFPLRADSERAMRDFLADHGAAVERITTPANPLLPLWDFIRDIVSQLAAGL